jgi:putative membrane protein
MSHLLLASNHAHDGDWGPGPWWPLIPLFWLLVIGTVVFFARRNGWVGRSGVRTLDDRFARGEIDADEYRSRKDVLKGKS